MRRRTGQVSEYGRELKEKQELKKIYGIREGQLERYFNLAQKMAGNPAENLLILLERRLDNVLFRAGFATSRPMARQFASHGLFKLNGRRVTIPSMLVKAGDEIEPRSKGQFDPEDVSTSMPWLELDRKNLRVKILRLPTREEIDTPVNETLVVQFYAR